MPWHHHLCGRSWETSVWKDTRSIFLALMVAAPGIQAQQPVAITNVNVVDVTSGQVRSGQTVLMTGKTIASVTSGKSAPAGARVVNGRGKYLVPGLWDMHVHLSMAGREALPVLLANGVTAVRDMGGSGPTVMAWRDNWSAASRTWASPCSPAPTSG